MRHFISYQILSIIIVNNIIILPMLSNIINYYYFIYCLLFIYYFFTLYCKIDCNKQQTKTNFTCRKQSDFCLNRKQQIKTTKHRE